MRRTGILLGLEAHDVVSEMCREWGTANSDEFYKYMNGLSDDQLRAFVESARRRLKRKEVVEKTAYREDVVLAYG
jgi:hypothetical protein